jgi:CheY-like chemotaxis protein
MTDKKSLHTIALLDPEVDATRLRELLTEEGFRVVSPVLNASLPNEIASTGADLIIADPFVSGWDQDLTALRNLRWRPATRDIPLIVCTSDTNELFFRQGTINAILRATVLVKPLTKQELMSAVHSALEGYR